MKWVVLNGMSYYLDTTSCSFRPSLVSLPYSLAAGGGHNEET